MELARAGGNSATFDVIVHHKDGRLTEFGMLPREELGPLESACVQGAWGIAFLIWSSPRDEKAGIAKPLTRAKDSRKSVVLKVHY